MGRTHPNLRGHWRFENNLTDTSGNGNNGTVGAGSAAYAAGKIGRAWDNDETRYISIPNNSFKTEEMTVCFLYYPLTNTPTSTIISDRTLTNNGFTVWHQIFSAGQMEWDFAESSSARRWSTGYTFTLNQWQHIVLTRTPYGRSLYVNGSFFSETSDGGGMEQTTGSDTQLGQNTLTGANSRIQSQLDDVQIWNRALAPHQIAAIYNGVDPAFIGDVA